jgi:hypothetical protein
MITNSKVSLPKGLKAPHFESWKCITLRQVECPLRHVCYCMSYRTWQFECTRIFVPLKILVLAYQRSRYSDWLRAGRQVGQSSCPDRVKNFLFSTPSRPALVPTQPVQWVPGALSPGVKRQGREADHSLANSAEVKKTWIYTSTPHTPW